MSKEHKSNSDSVHEQSLERHLLHKSRRDKGLCPICEAPFNRTALKPQTVHHARLWCKIEFIADCGHSCDCKNLTDCRCKAKSEVPDYWPALYGPA